MNNAAQNTIQGVDQSVRLAAALAYLIPVIGWLYVYLFQRKHAFAVYHLKQALGLSLFLIAVFVIWGLVAWVLAWFPLMIIMSIALFSLVIAAYLYGAAAWLMGISNALRSRTTPLPLFGRWADRRLPIQVN